MTALTTPERAAVAARFSRDNDVAGPALKADVLTIIGVMDNAVETFVNVTLPGELSQHAEAAKFTEVQFDMLARMIAEARWNRDNG